MGFTKENKPNHIVKFVFNEPFTSSDMTELLQILSSLLDTNIPFAFFVDTRIANKPPFNAASVLLKWMVANKYRFKKGLICSVVLFGSSVTNNIVSKLLKGVFLIQPTVSPNLLTSNSEEAERWINAKVVEFYQKN